MTRNLTQLYGKHLWVWEVTACGGVDGIIKTAKETGAHGVIVKAFDGVNKWDQFASSVHALKAAGLVVGAWGYVYPSNLAETAVQAAQAVTDGADYLMIDAESEFEAVGMDTVATEFGQRLRAIVPTDTVIGLTTFALQHSHRAFPYLYFAHWVDFLAPQVYWADAAMSPQAMLDNSLNQLAGYGREIFPVGQAYPQATPADIALFAAHATQRWIKGISWWSIQHMTSEIEGAVTRSEVYVPRATQKPVQAATHGLDAKQTETVAEIEKLTEELKKQ